MSKTMKRGFSPEMWKDVATQAEKFAWWQRECQDRLRDMRIAVESGDLVQIQMALHSVSCSVKYLDRYRPERSQR